MIVLPDRERDEVIKVQFISRDLPAGPDRMQGDALCSQGVVKLQRIRNVPFLHRVIRDSSQDIAKPDPLVIDPSLAELGPAKEEAVVTNKERAGILQCRVIVPADRKFPVVFNQEPGIDWPLHPAARPALPRAEDLVMLLVKGITKVFHRHIYDRCLDVTTECQKIPAESYRYPPVLVIAKCLREPAPVVPVMFNDGIEHCPELRFL